MKKLSGLLVAGLMLGSANLFAQLPEADSMNNAKNKMHKDSSWKSKNNTQRDSTWRSKNSSNKSDTVPSTYSTQKDNKWGSNKSMNGRDTTPNSQSMQKDSSWRSNSTYNRKDTMPSGHSMHNDSTANRSNHMSGEGRSRDTSATQNNSNNAMTSMMTPDVSSWPAAAKLAVDETTAKYGKPDGVTANELTWLNKGAFEKICITKVETKHSFPIEHTDMMQATIKYDVPEDKMDDLGKFDGSVTFDRTQGTMSARCDKEANNLLALNLAHDIITGKRTVVSARKAFADIVALKMKGGNPLLMAKLTFTPKSNTGDPDTTATSVTKKDVSKVKTQNQKK